MAELAGRRRFGEGAGAGDAASLTVERLGVTAARMVAAGRREPGAAGGGSGAPGRADGGTGAEGDGRWCSEEALRAAGPDAVADALRAAGGAVSRLDLGRRAAAGLRAAVAARGGGAAGGALGADDVAAWGEPLATAAATAVDESLRLLTVTGRASTRVGVTGRLRLGGVRGGLATAGREDVGLVRGCDLPEGSEDALCGAARRPDAVCGALMAVATGAACAEGLPSRVTKPWRCDAAQSALGEVLASCVSSLRHRALSQKQSD